MKKFFTFMLALATAGLAFAETLTPSQAAAEAAKLGDNESTVAEFTVEGYVSSTLGTPLSGAQSFWMADNADAKEGEGVFEAYKCVVPEEVVVGDKVQVTGFITKYVNANTGNVVPEINAGSVVIIEKGARNENLITFGAGEFANQGVSGTGGNVSATKNGVTVTASKAYGDGTYGVRVYAKSSFSITSEKRIIKIVFEFATVSGKYYDGGLDPEVCVEGTEWRVESMATQARCNSIKVYLGDEECSITPVEIPVIYVYQALEIGRALQPAEKQSLSTPDKYDVRGYIVGISEKKPNTFYLADVEDAYGEFQAYQCTSVEGPAEEGAYVSVVGKISNYNGGDYNSIEIANGELTVIWGAALHNTKAQSTKAAKIFDGKQVTFEVNGVRHNVLGTIVK